jgi:hypothetical protein
VVFRLVKKKGTGSHTLLDLGLSTLPARPPRAGAAGVRPKAGTPSGAGEPFPSSLGEILKKVLQAREQEETRDAHLQRLEFFNRQLTHLTCFLQMTPHAPMAEGARRTLESVLAAISDLNRFLVAECAVSEASPARAAGDESLDEAGLGELVVDEELTDPETLRNIELDLDGMLDEVRTIRAELADDRAWLELLKSGGEETASALRARLNETCARANELLRECQDALSRVPLHDEEGLADLLPPLAELPGPISPEPMGQAAPARPEPATSAWAAPARAAPQQAPPERAAPQQAPPERAAPQQAPQQAPSERAAPQQAPLERAASQQAPQQAPEQAPSEPAASEEDIDPEEELRGLQEYFNANSPAGTLLDARAAEFDARLTKLLRLAAPESKLSESTFELRARQLKSTLGLRKKLHNRLTLPEFQGFFR